MVAIPPTARELLESAALAHLATIDPDGAPQVSGIWVGVEDEEIVFASMARRRKIDNIERDPRITLSLEAASRNDRGLKEYLVVRGAARVTAGGAPELLQRLAHVHLGPGVRFPPMDDPPPGFVVRITPLRLGGVGPWVTDGG